MPYGIEALSLLQPVSADEANEGTAYFEFHPAELPDAHAVWQEGSLFLSDVAFDFYAECFHRANDAFDYFAHQRFDAEDIARLDHELESFVRDLERDPSQATLFSRYVSLFGEDIWAAIDVPVLAAAVAATANALRGFVREKTRESGCLWIIGM
jgi:hypothetical protein